jgi:hypothetical protein
MSDFLETVMAYLDVITVALPRLCYIYCRCLKAEYRLELLKARVQRINWNTNEAEVIKNLITELTNELSVFKDGQKNFLRKILLLDGDSQRTIQLGAQSGDQNIARTEPPRIAEFLVGLFAKKRYRKAILSDLAEDFDSDLAAGMSVNHAGRRYWAAALNSIIPQALAALKRIGLVGLVFDYARRWMG